MAQRSPGLANGVRLGPYEVLHPLGCGGMGEVWKARDTRLDRIVAVKRLFEPGPRFEREARAIAALNHPHICQIYDIGPDYLILEYLEGRTLSDWLWQRGQEPPPLDDTLRLAIEIAAALEQAHRQSILHRDLKPANIMVVRGQAGGGPATAKILDFGLAKPVHRDPNVTETSQGVIAGTAAYMSPEQARGEALDARSDIFSLGAVLFEMFERKRAFTGGSMVEILHAVMHADVPRLEGRAALDGIVRRCLEKSPARRFQSAEDVRVALEDLRERPGIAPADDRQSIAVLPFANLSADKDNEYFADGLTEEIIIALTQVSGLKVTARTSAFAFRGKDQDIRQIAETLRVRTVLEGSVRRSGSRVRVAAQLIDATDGYHLWSDRYDRELTEVFAIQDDIARAIVESLHQTLKPRPPVARYQPDPSAYDAFLKARHLMGHLIPEALSRSRVLLDRAIAIDPGFAQAHQQLSQYYLLQTLWGGRPAREMMPRARHAALAALAHAPSLSEALAILGVIAGIYDFDWVEQERQFLLALRDGSASADVEAHYGIHCLLLTGRPAEAVVRLTRALDRDPLNPVFRVQRAICLDTTGAIDHADSELQQVLEWNDQVGPAAEWLAVLRAFRGRFDEAVHHADQAFALAGRKTRFAGLLAGILERTGDHDRARNLVAALGDGEAYGVPVELMMYNLLQSNLTVAAAWAERAIAQRDGYVLVLLSSHAGVQLRTSPHWPHLAGLMNRPVTA